MTVPAAPTRDTWGPIGLSVNVTEDGAHLNLAAEAESLGYGALWVPGGQLDRLDRVRELAVATREVPIATGIIPPDTYSADQVAGLYSELEDRAPGRFVVGLGAPQRPRALGALNTYLDRLDAAGVPAQRRILAAVGPRKLALARERFAGAVPLLVTPEYVRNARGILGPDAVLVVSLFAVLDTDPAGAREAARQPLRFLLSGAIPGYLSSMTRLGFTAAETAGLSDRLVDALVAWGDPQTIAAFVTRLREAGADQVLLNLLDGTGTPSTGEAARVMAAELGLSRPARSAR